MNAYITEQLAREQVGRRVAEAELARQVRRARKARRARRGSSDTIAQLPGGSARPTRPRRAAVAHFVARPFTAFQAWLAAGYL